MEPADPAEGTDEAATERRRAQLVTLSAQLVAYLMEHNAEAEACDLLMEIERLDLLEQHVSKDTYQRVCLYLTRSGTRGGCAVTFCRVFEGPCGCVGVDVMRDLYQFRWYILRKSVPHNFNILSKLRHNYRHIFTIFRGKLNRTNTRSS